MARILIVDDEESDRLLLQSILGAAGHETVLAKDGGEAIDKLRPGGVDLVLTDLQMPEIHGFELIGTLREMTPPPAIIAISSTGDFQLEMAQALGASHTISKPVRAQELVDLVELVLSSRGGGVSESEPA